MPFSLLETLGAGRPFCAIHLPQRASGTKAGSACDLWPRSARRGILEWIVQAKRPETRVKRVAETARLAQENIRANQWRP